MNGVIDRVDICVHEDNVYVRIVDYKTGKKDFDLVKTYYGLDIQLMIYMEAAIRLVKKNMPDKNVIPAGIFYQSITDPIVDFKNTDENIEDIIRGALRLKGMVNSDSDIAEKMDSSEGKSLNIPVARNAKGEFIERSSKLMSTAQFNMLGSYVDTKTIDNARRITEGEILKNPYKDGEYSSCTHCAYNAVCGFTTDLPGYSYRKIKKFNDEELWNNIREEVDENGKKMD